MYFLRPKSTQDRYAMADWALQDAAAVEKQAAKEAAQDAAKKHKHSIPTVKTEAQTKAEAEAAAKAGRESSDPQNHAHNLVYDHSEAKAVESGATFISETFLFSVAAGLLFFESWRSRRKETTRREDVADRLNDLEESEKAARRALVELEKEVLRLQARQTSGATNMTRRILPLEMHQKDENNETDSNEIAQGWFSRIASYIATRGYIDNDVTTDQAVNTPGPAEKILVESDRNLEEKHKLEAIEAAEKAPAEKRQS